MSLALVAIAAARPEGKNRYYGGYARYLGRSLTSTSDPSSTADPYQMDKEEVGNESRSRYGRGYYPMPYYMPPYPEPFGYPLLEFTPNPAPPVNGAADGADTHPATATATASPSPTEN